MSPRLAFQMWLIFVYVLALALTDQHSGRINFQNNNNVMYEWVYLDYDWPSEQMKARYIAERRYIIAHNFLSAVKTYKSQVYVTVPRLGYTTGVPSTLNVLVNRGDSTVLRPFPNWAAQELGNCNALQCAMSIEVDPLNGHIYVIDPGRAGILGPNTTLPRPVVCPAKLVVYDLHDGKMIRSHVLPENLVAKETNYLNDIVLDRGDRSSRAVKWVYITDAADSKLIAFDMVRNVTTIFQHPSMNADPGAGSDITVNGRVYTLRIPIDGLAISPDFNFVYYCALGSKDLYQVPTSVLRDPRLDFGAHVRFVGAKVSQTGGMTYATNNLYYGALGGNAVYKWEILNDRLRQSANESAVVMNTQTLVARDDLKLQWPDSFTVDDNGHLWFTACKAQLFLRGGMDYSGNSGPNYRIWRVRINEGGYLNPSNHGDPLVG
ncbi:major royal jelly protein 2-like [Biomphalaria glabrata]|uniref:Major royal jelly protein 2-like n=1 Tax=Biomphalaria glabrata TaxID=6526 RepID=A0A9W3AKN5_BIOGL|nr:major royal jelly protein 2-like [Biomphalaria glabrata]XP_055887867.1 major royal jelly protein 2-like [Biomphalaria glabrata]